jgi:flagellar biosynthesis protein FliQ
MPRADGRGAAGLPALPAIDATKGEGEHMMSGPEVMDVARDAIMTLLLVAGPLMLVGLVVGVAISLLQALTQIQETTLVFIPKILAIFLALLIALPFMADVLHANFLRITEHIING